MVIGSKVICTISIVCFHFFTNADVTGQVKSIGDYKLYVEFKIDNKVCNDGNKYTMKKLVYKNQCIEDSN
jgi:hypothetical protein